MQETITKRQILQNDMFENFFSLVVYFSNNHEDILYVLFFVRGKGLLPKFNNEHKI